MKTKITVLALAIVLAGVLLAVGCGSVPDTVKAAQPTADSFCG